MARLPPLLSQWISALGPYQPQLRQLMPLQTAALTSSSTMLVSCSK